MNEMKKNQIIVCLLTCIFLLDACNYDEPRNMTETKEENTIEYDVIFTDKDSSIQIAGNSSKENEYMIISEDGTGYFESNILYSAIRKIRVDNWDNSFLTVVMEDGTEEQVFIFEKDTLGEIKIVSPYLTVQDLFRITTKPDDKKIVISCLNQEIEVIADNLEAVAFLEKTIQCKRDICFDTDNKGIYAKIPLGIGKEKELGYFKLYYEFDGVGLTCISKEFVSCG